MRTPMYIAYRSRAVAAAVLLALGSASTAALAQSPAATSAAKLTALDWDKSNAKSLLKTIAKSEKEGLDPAFYGYDALKLAVETGDQVGIDYLATAAAIQLASDYRYGRTPGAQRVDWHMGGGPNPAAMMPLIQDALEHHRVSEAIENQLPNSKEYKALRGALADASDNSTEAQQIKVNMERWRWMPRSLGSDHVFVNVPAHRVVIVKDGEVVAEHDAIVGAPATPTPALMTEISAVALNPTWTVPPVLKAEKLAYVQKNPALARKQGYSLVKTSDGVRVVQAAGGSNALGQVKLVMPNEYAIFLHDTSNRKAFNRDARNLSHGCIRVENPVEMVNELLEGSEWDQTRVQETLDSRKSAQAKLAAPVPVYITYMTATVADDGSVKLLNDPYKRDAGVIEAMQSKATSLPTIARTQTAALD